MGIRLEWRRFIAAMSILGMFALTGCGHLEGNTRVGSNEKRARAMEQTQEKLEFRRNLRNW